MAADAYLRFMVQGSAATPYKLTAEGVGSAFRMFCSCPAGRKARMLCKHVASLLMGDVSALVDPSDDVEELAKWAHGSEILVHAFHHRPASAKPTITAEASVEDGLHIAFASLVQKAEAAGWVVRATPQYIRLHEFSKTGRVRKHFSMSFGIADGFARPFFVSAPEGASRSYGSPERAAAHFGEMIARFAPANKVAT